MCINIDMYKHVHIVHMLILVMLDVIRWCFEIECCFETETFFIKIMVGHGNKCKYSMTANVMNYGNKMYLVSWSLVFWDVILHCLRIN